MSKYSQGYMGDQIGKLGPAVGFRWKGRAVMRAYLKHIANPNTLAQRIVRARFRVLTQMASAFSRATVIGLNDVAKENAITEGNAFFKLNYSRVTAISPDEVTVSYSGLKVSQGNLTGVTFGAVDYGEGEHLHLSVAMTGNSDAPDADASDKVYVFAYCPELSQGVLSLPALRSAAQVSMALPASWDGMDIHVYGFTVGAKEGLNLGKKSGTTYCGTGEVA